MTAYDSSLASYVREVLSHIPRTSHDRQQIEADLRAHLAERIEAGNSVAAAIAAMGDPKAVAASYLGDRPLHYAPYGRRFMAAMIDFALIALGGIVPLGILVWIFSGGEWPLWTLGLALATIISWVITSMIYFPVAEAVFGQTVGKWLFGLTVVTESGLAIGAKEAVIRRLPYIFQMVVWLDAIFIFVGQKRQRAFDHVAGTVVVRTT